MNFKMHPFECASCGDTIIINRVGPPDENDVMAAESCVVGDNPADRRDGNYSKMVGEMERIGYLLSIRPRVWEWGKYADWIRDLDTTVRRALSHHRRYGLRDR